MVYSIIFSNYAIEGEEERLIDEYELPYKENKEVLESILIKLNYQFIGNDDIWGICTNHFMSIAEIVAA